MLVLTRSLNQSIFIGDPNSDTPPIEIKILEIQKNQAATLGINAPPGVKLHRKEIWEQLQAENEAAAMAGGKDLPALSV